MKRSSIATSLFLIVSIWVIWPFIAIKLYGVPHGSGEFGDIYGGITALFTGLTFAGLVYTLWLQHEDLKIAQKSLLADHERRKLEATLMALQHARPTLKEFSLFMDSIAGYRQNIKAEHLDHFKNDVNARTRLHDYLEQCENLSIALNCELYDDDFAFRLTGPFLTNLWSRSEIYVRDFRHNWPTVGVEFEKLGERYLARTKHLYGSASLKHNPEK